jgi:hypothetical protein
LSREQREELARLLVEWPEIARVRFVTGRPVPVLAFQFDDRPERVGHAGPIVQDVMAGVAPALGDTARSVKILAGGADELAVSAPGGEVVYERA